MLLASGRAATSTVLIDLYSPTWPSLLRAFGSSSLDCCSGIGRVLRGSALQRNCRRTESSPTGQHGAGDGRASKSLCPCPYPTWPSLPRASGSSGLGAPTLLTARACLRWAVPWREPVAPEQAQRSLTRQLPPPRSGDASCL